MPFATRSLYFGCHFIYVDRDEPSLVAAILGAVLIAVFLMIWMLADKVDPPFKNIFAYLAIHNDHFNGMANGIIHTRSLIYYFSFIWLFLEFSVRVLDARRWRG